MDEEDECTECGWQGSNEDKSTRKESDGFTTTLVCKKCGHDEFYVSGD